MTSPSPTFYVFHGRDEFTRAETVADFRRRLGPADVVDLNTVWLDGSKVTFGELRHSCEAVPFMADKRLVVVDGLLSRLAKEKGSYLDGLLEMLTSLPETSRLVFVEEVELAKSHPVVKLAASDERGYIRQFEPPSNRELPAWVVRRAKKHGGSITAEAAAYLAEVVGPDLRLLDQELTKLVTYAGGKEIDRDQVIELVPYAQQAVIFDLVDALGHRNGQVASSTLQRLLDGGEHPLSIFGMIVRQFRLLIQVLERKQAGENAASIARTLKLHDFVARKLYHQAGNFTADQLEYIYRHLLTTDAQIKRGELLPQVALDLLVGGLADRAGVS
jgi:DNA polymerase-3 subunit delta